MNLLKVLRKKVKGHHVLLLVGAVVLVVAYINYGNSKNSILSNLKQKGKDKEDKPVSSIQPSNPDGKNEQYSSVHGQMSNSPDNSQKKPLKVTDPADLLPKDVNNKWAAANPNAQGDLNSVSFLKAGYLQGMNTVGTSLRNPSLQVRPEPPNPQSKVSPWMNTSMDANKQVASNAF